jgi:Bacterial TSP3 repeat
MRALVVVACVLGACSLSQRPDASLVPEPAADGGTPIDAATLSPDDTDGDGLCNETEKDVGTDPEVLDTDGDGYPDLVEVMAEFDALDALSPGLDQVATLAAERGRVLDFEVRATVDGMGEGYTGVFAAYPSTNVDGLMAVDFLKRSTAFGAEPLDHVRGVDVDGAHFDSVLGRTRLSFRLRFAFNLVSSDFPCADAFSFTYGVKDDLGRRRGVRDYVLIVVPEGATGMSAADFCVPPACF